MKRLLLFSLGLLILTFHGILARVIHVPSQFSTIQAGINAGINGDTILVSPGVYVENINFGGHSIRLISQSGAASTTIRIATTGQSVIKLISQESVFSCIEGFTIQGDSSSYGIELNGSSPLIYGNIIKNHMIGIYGGNNGSPIVRKNEILGCYHPGDGQVGGAVRLFNISNMVIDSNDIHSNFCTISTGIHLQYCSYITIDRNLVYDNGALNVGAIGLDNCSHVDVLNNTMVNNTTPYSVYGTFTTVSGDNINVENNIIAFSTEYGLHHRYNDQYPQVDYNDIYSNSNGNSNYALGAHCIYTDPLLMDLTSNLNLQPNSPCIDAGNPFSPGDPDGTRADIGALYYIQDMSHYGFLQGTVVDSLNIPLANAAVSIVNMTRSDSTDIQGHFSLGYLEADTTYDIRVRHYAFVDTTITNVQINPVDTTDLYIQMTSAHIILGAIGGIVTGDSSRPLEDAVVMASPGGFADTTDSQGRYLIASIFPRNYALTFSHPEYRTIHTDSITVIPGDTASFDVTMYLFAECDGIDYVPGDINGTHAFTGLDVVYGINYFRGGAPPPVACQRQDGSFFFVAGDVNSDCQFSLSDLSRSIDYFHGGRNISFCPFAVPLQGGTPPDTFCNHIDQGIPDTLIFGNLDHAPIYAFPGDTVLIPVWLKNDDNILALSIPLETEDRYISGRLGGNDFSPQNHWTYGAPMFLTPIADSASYGFSIQTLNGWAEGAGDTALNTLGQFQEVAEFKVIVSNDPSNIGIQTALFEGIQPRLGRTVFSDGSGFFEWNPIVIPGQLAIVSPANRGNIAGTITDSLSHPIDGVVVRALGTQFADTSGTNGHFMFYSMAVGSYNLSFSKRGYADTTIMGVAVAEGETTIVDVSLRELRQSDFGIITGIVTDSVMNPIGDVAVWTVPLGASDTTDSQGRYSLEYLTPGIYDIVFSHTLYQDTTISNIQVRQGEIDTLNISLRQGYIFYYIFFGNLTGDTIPVTLGSTIDIPVWGVTPAHDYTDSVFYMHVPLATDNSIIAERLGGSFPDTLVGRWDLKEFLAPDNNSPYADWTNQSLLAIAYIWEPRSPQNFFWTDGNVVPICTFRMRVTDDSSRAGDFVSPFMEGLNPANGTTIWGMSDGIHSVVPIASYPWLHLLPSGQTGSVTGIVFAGDTPLADVYVSIASASVSDTTNIDGSYYLGGIIPGSYDVRFYKPDIVDTTISGVTVTAGDTLELNLLLFQPPNCNYELGDINGNRAVNGVDIVFAVNYFKGTGNPPPVDCAAPAGPCPEQSPFYAAGDVNGNCAFNGIDVTYFVRFLKLLVPGLLSCADCPPGYHLMPSNIPTDIKSSNDDY